MEEGGVEEVKTSILRDQLGLPRDKDVDEKEKNTLSVKKPSRGPMKKSSPKGHKNENHQRFKTRRSS